MDIDQFMAALSGQESGGSYTAENARTGAYGRFQIMPSNWPAWSQEAGLGPNAPQTPENQEKVARFKLQQYYDTFGNWRDVASAWYSGSPLGAYNQEQLTRKQGNGDEPSILEYVNSVMGRAGESGDSGGLSLAERKQYQSEIDQANAVYDDLRRRYLEDPDSVSIDELIQARSLADQAQARLDDLDAVGYDHGQDAFANSIALGDYQRRQADSAWQRWLDKRSMAEDAAKSEIATRQGHNAEQAQIEAARQENFGQGPQASTITYLPQNYEDVLNKYLDKLGVGEAPSANPADYGGPAIPSAARSRQYQEGAGYPQNEQSGPWSTVFGADPNAPGKPAFDAKAFLNEGRGGAQGYPGQTILYEGEGKYLDPSIQSPTAAKGGMYGDDGKVFGVGGLNDLKPGIPRSYAEFLLGRDQKLFGMNVGKPGGKKWWKKARGIVGFADGTLNAPGGLARVGEKGPETMIDPRTGQPMMVGQHGPEVRDVPQGAQIYPADVPPDEAFAYSQMLRMTQESPDQRIRQQAEAQARASDPELQQKVLAALQEAVVARTVSNPPPTPALAGPWTKPDPWADYRPLNTPVQQVAQ